jgi:3-hydroxyisobutyrate dehydrogenase-like beta-hydroxyacid dehydrogenase
MGLKAGLDMQSAVDIINQGSGANFFSQRMFPNFMLKGKFTGTGAIEIGLKDVKLFLQEAASLDMETPVAAAICDIQKAVVDSGPAGRDTMTYLHYFTDLAGLPRQGCLLLVVSVGEASAERRDSSTLHHRECDLR